MEAVFSMVLNGITRGFAGTLTYFLYYSMSNSTEPSMFLFFLAGVSGWLGGGSIKFFVAIWKAFLHTQGKGGDLVIRIQDAAATNDGLYRSTLCGGIVSANW